VYEKFNVCERLKYDCCRIRCSHSVGVLLVTMSLNSIVEEVGEGRGIGLDTPKKPKMQCSERTW